MNTAGDVQTQPSEANMVSIQIQLGRIEGTLNTIVSEHGRRILDTEGSTRQLRFDLTAVKENATREVTELATKIADVFEKAKAEGNETRRQIEERVTTNKNNIEEIRGDVQELKDKQNAAFGKAMLIVSPLIAVAALIWNVTGGK